MNHEPPPGAADFDPADAGILIVDDDPANLHLLEDILLSRGIGRITLCEDPHEALRRFEAEPFDLVLLDLMMPGLDGFDLLDAFSRARNLDLLPVVVVSSLDDQEHRNRALRSGATDFICKPVDEDEVVVRCVNLLESRMLKLHLAQLVERRTRQLATARRDILDRLGRAAEYRDNETGNHVRRIGLMSEALARAAGGDEPFCEHILLASPMHDVGKIGIPDAILLKPGRLEGEEWPIMQTHAAIGANILGGSTTPLLQMAAEIALTHHEKWDGSGYPRGLAGAAIPLEGRICALVDVFDALVSERPYKKAWSVEAAVALIRDGAGHHFDPHLTGLFLERLPEMQAIRDRLRDRHE